MTARQQREILVLRTILSLPAATTAAKASDRAAGTAPPPMAADSVKSYLRTASRPQLQSLLAQTLDRLCETEAKQNR